jgi:hypothetical protein
MKPFKRSVRGLICLFTLSWLFSQAAGQAQDPISREAGKSNLIRMDLLRLSQGESRPFQRNIFAPGPAYGAPSPSGAPVSQVSSERQVSPEFQPQGEEVRTEVVTPAFSVNLRYVGFIVSARRLIALVILEEQALAVAEGEVVREGVRIGKISVDEIEVILPDSSTRKFPLEGE